MAVRVSSSAVCDAVISLKTLSFLWQRMRVEDGERFVSREPNRHGFHAAIVPRVVWRQREFRGLCVASARDGLRGNVRLNERSGLNPGRPDL